MSVIYKFSLSGGVYIFLRFGQLPVGRYALVGRVYNQHEVYNIANHLLFPLLDKIARSKYVKLMKNHFFRAANTIQFYQCLTTCGTRKCYPLFVSLLTLLPTSRNTNSRKSAIACSPINQRILPTPTRSLHKGSFQVCCLLQRTAGNFIEQLQP